MEQIEMLKNLKGEKTSLISFYIKTDSSIFNVKKKITNELTNSCNIKRRV